LIELDIVDKVTKREVLNTVKYIFEDGSELEATLDHPLYVRGKSWASYDNQLSNKMYNIGGVSKIEVGDYVKTSNDFKQIKSITKNTNTSIVYNLSQIRNNHNFFANDVLVHNRGIIVFIAVFSCFTYDTPVKMWDATTKKIGDIVLGDCVLSYRNGEYVKGVVTDKLTHPTNDIVEVVKCKGMIADRLHPFYNNGEWKPICEADGVEFGIQYVDNFYNLEIDGNLLFESEHNFIVEDFIVSGLGDNELLNKTFKRQAVYECV
jgi:intein/homing endonuclease